MANLVDRIAQDDERGHAYSLSAHEFSAALFLYGVGELTKAQIEGSIQPPFGAADQTQFDAVITYINGLTANQKLAFHGRIEACNVLLQSGKITKAKYKSMLGINGG